MLTWCRLRSPVVAVADGFLKEGLEEESEEAAPVVVVQLGYGGGWAWGVSPEAGVRGSGDDESGSARLSWKAFREEVMCVVDIKKYSRCTDVSMCRLHPAPPYRHLSCCSLAVVDGGRFNLGRFLSTDVTRCLSIYLGAAGARRASMVSCTVTTRFFYGVTISFSREGHCRIDLSTAAVCVGRLVLTVLCELAAIFFEVRSVTYSKGLTGACYASFALVCARAKNR